MSLKKIEDNVFSRKRLTPDDALILFHSEDIFTLGRLASRVAYRINGNNAYFVQNHHINPTNICVNRCKFCAFSRSKGEKGAYELSIKDIIGKLKTQNSKLMSQESGVRKELNRITHYALRITVFQRFTLSAGFILTGHLIFILRC